MNKYIVVALSILAMIFSATKASAATNDYVNLIDVNQVQYSLNDDVFYSEQKIGLLKDTCYTLVVSSSFFGNVTKENKSALSNTSMGTSFTSLTGEELLLNLPLTYSSSGMYYSSITPSEDCYLKFTDFLTKGYTLTNLPKNQIQFFVGAKEEFKGFRESEYIEGYEKVSNTINIYTSCVNPIKTEDITNRIKMYDNVDGFTNSFTLLEDGYKNSSNVGVYEIVYKALDKANNETVLVVKVNVIDTDPPVISGPEIIEFDCYGSAPYPEEILSHYTAYDEIDGVLTSKISIQTSGLVMYQSGKTKDYAVVLVVSDKSGNKTTKSIVMRAKDMFAPTLEVKDVEIKLSELGQTLFENFFEQVLVSVTDNSKKYTVEYECNTVIGDFGFTGTYEITVIVKDNALNTTTKKAYIKIIDDIAPEFYMHSDLLDLTTDKVYSLEEIKEAISDSLHQDGILFDEINLISCDYISNEKNPGEYTVKYSYSYKGETNYMVGTISVTEKEEPTYYWVLPLLIIPVIGVVVYINKKRQSSY